MDELIACLRMLGVNHDVDKSAITVLDGKASCVFYFDDTGKFTSHTICSGDTDSWLDDLEE